MAKQDEHRVEIQKDAHGRWAKVSRAALVNDLDGTYDEICAKLKCERAHVTGETIHCVFWEPLTDG